jgi:beta-hydroxylase
MHDVLNAPEGKQTIWLLRKLVSLSDSALDRFLPGSAVLGEGEDVSAVTPWMTAVDSQLPDIREEASSVLNAIEALPRFGDVAKVGPGANLETQWRLYPFVLMHRSLPTGLPTPVTRQVVGQIPGLVNGFFSILSPGTKLHAHRGTSRLLLRCHVGLCIPRDYERCFFVVDGHKHVWRAGHKFLFDQTFEHYAVNDTDEYRAILILDVVRPELPRPIRSAVAAVTYLLGFHREARHTLRNYRTLLGTLRKVAA